MLSAVNISKLFAIYKRPADRFKEAVCFGRKTLHQDFWALHGINVTVEPGETLGVIGSNGSGKSTLLQILAGILPPTTGWVSRNGRISVLLELGAGFNPELTGRENVFINGELLGLSRPAIRDALPRIKEFADIGEFLDRPVKTYSSGMYARLAFSTAIHVEPDVLIVDEALAVGDAAFSSHCVQRFEQLQRRGVTTVLVSHDLSLIKQVCNRAIFLHQGKIQAEGIPSEIVNHYVGSILNPPTKSNREPPTPSCDTLTSSISSHRHGDHLAEITSVELSDAQGRPNRNFGAGELVRLRIVAHFHQAQSEPMIGMLIRTRNGMDVFGTNTRHENISPVPCAAGDVAAIEFSFDCNLTPQQYTVTVAVQYPNGQSHDWMDDVLTFEVTSPRRPAGVADLRPKVTFQKTSARP